MFKLTDFCLKFKTSFSKALYRFKSYAPTVSINRTLSRFFLINSTINSTIYNFFNQTHKRDNLWFMRLIKEIIT